MTLSRLDSQRSVIHDTNSSGEIETSGEAFMSMLTLPTEGLNNGMLEFLNLWKADKMARIKESILASKAVLVLDCHP